MPRALITVSDKSGLAPFVKALVDNWGYTIYSSSGTEAFLKEHGIPVISVRELTKNPEAFGGRMKTISFELGSSLLYRRDDPQDVREALELGIVDINLVVCNLYPFAEVAKKGGSIEELIENIDIGGPLLLRASAKNYKSVAPVCDPSDYENILSSLKENQGQIHDELRAQLALKTWQHVTEYDQLISVTLHQVLGNKLDLAYYLKSQSNLRYGENPHQSGIFYVSSHQAHEGFSRCEIIQGKELSYNNYLDADAAIRIVSELKWTLPSHESVAVVKHGNPCGLSTSKDLHSAFFTAWESDKISRFGGIICFSGEVSSKIAQALIEVFVDVIIAPSFSSDALKVLSAKKNLRVIRMDLKKKSKTEVMLRSVFGGFLVQEEDETICDRYEIKTQSQLLNDCPIELMQFGEIACKYLKSNAIALVAQVGQAFALVGGGSGQPNRIDSFCDLAWKRYQAQFPEVPPQDIILVSDAFFPFSDIVDECGKRGVKKIIQPGGSIQDPLVINRANELGISMAFTGLRHFRHG